MVLTSPISKVRERALNVTLHSLSDPVGALSLGGHVSKLRTTDQTTVWLNSADRMLLALRETFKLKQRRLLELAGDSDDGLYSVVVDHIKLSFKTMVRTWLRLESSTTEDQAVVQLFLWRHCFFFVLVLFVGVCCSCCRFFVVALSSHNENQTPLQVLKFVVTFERPVNLV